MKSTMIVLQALDGSILVKRDVTGFYMIGFDVVVVQFVDGSEYYYTNYKVINNGGLKWF